MKGNTMFQNGDFVVIGNLKDPPWYTMGILYHAPLSTILWSPAPAGFITGTSCSDSTIFRHATDEERCAIINNMKSLPFDKSMGGWQSVYQNFILPIVNH